MRGDHLDWQEVERVITAVLELSEGQRAVFLAQQPPPIRAEVESLLEAYGRAGSFLGDEPNKPIAPAELMSRIKAMFAADPALNIPDASARKPIGVTAGTQLGQYRIESLIGQGGMGMVYRALDTKLNRPVAVKFLFDDLADPAAQRRFQREAQMASSLNHPHILTVYDAGDFDSRQYLVTEYVDGGTLKDWARAEKRTWRDIVTLLLGVADGLAAAHNAGILHRDIKPDNILVGRNGYAKLSDFGLAKLQGNIPADGPTRTLSTHTAPGMIMGTIAYMSPEQASGLPTDTRSDIFSFGIVLYELLAGRRPFEGRSELEVLQTVIHGAPAPLGPEVPHPLRMVVEKALEKAPADRYQSTRDLVVDLRRLTRQSGESPTVGTTAPSAPIAPKTAFKWKPGVLAALVLVLVLGGVSLWWFNRPAAQAPRQVVQFDFSPPAGTFFAPPVSRQPFAISPDGKRLAFSATGANGSNIWIRDLASTEMHAVAGTEGVWSIFWAPDNRSIFFSVKKTLKQANLETGANRIVAELPNIARLGTWHTDGALVLYLGGGDTYELRLDDGSLKKGPAFERTWPQFLPGSDRLLYVSYVEETKRMRAMVADYAGRKQVPLMETDSRVQYAAPLHAGEAGHLLFIRGASLLAQSFEADGLKLASEPFPIAQNVVYYGSNLAACFSVSTNGVLVYQANFPVSELKWYDRSGKEVSQAGRPSNHWGQVRASRDGQRVAATVWSPENGGTAIWIFDANGRESRRFTDPKDIHRRPVWSPDGKRLAYGGSTVIGLSELTILDAAGGGTAEHFVNQSPKEHIGAYLPTDWSWDGRFILFDDGLGEEQGAVWLADVANHTESPFLKGSFSQGNGAFSRDGKWIAFVSHESGRPEVYVQGFEATPSPHMVGDRRQVSRDGAWLVRWRPDGRELFFVGLDNSLYAAPVAGPLQFGEPKALFRIPGESQYGTTRDFQFDVSPDGHRFVMPTTGSVPPPPFTVIENWQAKFHR